MGLQRILPFSPKSTASTWSFGSFRSFTSSQYFLPSTESTCSCAYPWANPHPTAKGRFADGRIPKYNLGTGRGEKDASH
jgi:hypothetical protein